MTINPTVIKIRLLKTYLLNKSNGYMDPNADSSSAAYKAATALLNYYNSEHTPTISSLKALMADLVEARELSTTNAQYNAINNLVSQVELEYGAINQGKTDLSNLFPKEELGVTFASLKSYLVSALAPVDGEDSASLLASAIFDTVNALNPSLTLEMLEADIQAAIDNGMSAANLRAALLEAVEDADPTAVELGKAFYKGGLLALAPAQLELDIIAKEKLIDLNLIKAALITLCNDNTITTLDGLANSLHSIFSNLHGSISFALTLDSLKQNIGAAMDDKSIAQIKTNILSNLGSIDNTTTEESLMDAVFATNALIPSDPRDFAVDVLAAHQLMILQNIYDDLSAACDDVDGETTSDAFATAIMNAVKHESDATIESVEQDLSADIAASGDLEELAAKIKTALSGLNRNTLTKEQLQNALYHADRIISSHPSDLLRDVNIEQKVLNYNNIKSALHTAVSAATDAESLRDAIINNIGNNPSIDGAMLLEDINAYVASNETPITNLISAIATAINNLDIAASVNAGSSVNEVIRNAIYNYNLLVSSNRYALKEDLTHAETLRSYAAIIEKLKDITSGYMSGGNIGQFYIDIYNGMQLLGVSPSLSSAALGNDVIASIHQDGVSSVAELATAIYTALVNLGDSNLSLEGIKSALYGQGRIISANPYNLMQDAIRTEGLIDLANIKAAIISASTTAYNSNGNNDAITAYATAIIAAVGNRTLSVEYLVEDIKAGIATAQTTLQALANSIKANLNNIADTDLTIAGIMGALYGTGKIISSNPYDMQTDIQNNNSILETIRIRDAIISELGTITIDNSHATLSTKIVGAVGVPAGNTRQLKISQLTSDIDYTIEQDNLLQVPVYGNDMSILALAITTSLTGVTTLEGIQSGIYHPDRIIQNPATINIRNDTQSLYNDLTTRQTTLLSNSNNYNIVAGRIWTALDGLSVGYNSDDVATAIFNAIEAVNPTFSVEELKADIDATGGSLSALVASIKSAIGGSTPSSFTTALAVKNAVYNSLTTLGTTDQDALTADIGTHQTETNSFGAIKANIVTNLDSSVSYQSIITGLHTILTNQIASPTLTNEAFSPDFSAGMDGKTEEEMKASLILNLGNTPDTAEGIRDAIYEADTVISAETNANKFLDDVTFISNAHYYFDDIKADLKTELSGSFASALELATAITSVLDKHGITLQLTAEELAADITATTNNFGATANGLKSSLDFASNNADSIRGAIYQALSYANVASNALKTDIANFATSRESTYFGQVANNFRAILPHDGTSSLDNAKIDQLQNSLSHVATHKWTADKLREDGNILEAVASQNIWTDLGSATTAQAIVDAFYSQSGISPATTGSDNLLTDLNTIHNHLPSLRSGSNLYSVIGQNIKTALDNLTDGYTSTDVATAIINAVTPSSVDKLLVIEELAGDIDYTLANVESYQGDAGLADLVANIKAYLADNLEDFDMPNHVKYSIFLHNLNNLIVSATDDAGNFMNDIDSVALNHNSYGTIKEALEDLDHTGIDLAATITNRIKAKIELNSYNLNVTAFEADIEASVTNADYGALVTFIKTHAANADVSNTTTAARNLVAQFYQDGGLMSGNSILLQNDFQVSNDIDNFVTDRSAIGGQNQAVCRAGASHTIYSCSIVNGVKTVGSLIAENDCTIVGKKVAETQCYEWASQPGVDLYASYSNSDEGCSHYLGSHAAAYCLAGLDIILS